MEPTLYPFAHRFDSCYDYKQMNMKKKTTYTIFAYEPGTEVYAISKWFDNKRETDHLAIYKAKVASWSFDAEEKDVMYYLESPKDGKWWGDAIKGEYVSDSMDELITYAKEIWKNETEMQFLEQPRV